MKKKYKKLLEEIRLFGGFETIITFAETAGNLRSDIKKLERKLIKYYIDKKDYKLDQRYIHHRIDENETKISIKWYHHTELVEKLKKEIAKPLDNFKEELQLLRNKIEELENAE